MNSGNLPKKTEQHVVKMFDEHKMPHLVYHNLAHTRYVVEKAEEIASHYKLSGKEMDIVLIAAWFHDTGYLFGDPEHHEEKSIEQMRNFLTGTGAENSMIDEVAGCIQATHLPQNPTGLLQQIVCDADMYNLGTKDFKATNKQVFKELENLSKGTLTKAGFENDTLKMLEGHVFFTSYCQDKLEERKKANLNKLRTKVEELEAKPGPAITEKEGTIKGMQTMLRLTSSNHISLSEIADHKANILISVNSIIISVILSVLLRRFQTDPYLVIPTIIFLVVSVTTIVISILATRPIITSGTFVEDDILKKKTNLLFFGNFHKVSQETYEKAMRSMMKDSDYLYSSIVQDIYHLGRVLGRKYKLIRLAYNVFMIGIILTVVAFAIASLSRGEPVQSVVNTSGGSPF